MTAITGPTKAHKTDADNGSKTISLVSNDLRSPSPDRSRSAASPMSTVFILQHVHEFDDGHEDVKLIGVFSSQALARAAQQRVSDQPGFRDLPDGFVISEHHVDGEVGWREGYATFQPDQE